MITTTKKVLVLPTPNRSSENNQTITTVCNLDWISGLLLTYKYPVKSSKKKQYLYNMRRFPLVPFSAWHWNVWVLREQPVYWPTVVHQRQVVDTTVWGVCVDVVNGTHCEPSRNRLATFGLPYRRLRESKKINPKIPKEKIETKK